MGVMNDTPSVTEAVSTPQTQPLFVSFYWSGLDNGVPKSGFDSRVLEIPADVELRSAGDLVEVSNALINSYFQEKKYGEMEIALLNFQRLPI